MPKKNPKDEADYYYNIARKEEEENETREERAKYKLDAENEKIWNIYRYVYAPNLMIRDIVDQQDNISLVRAYQIVLDYGGIERLRKASDYTEVNAEIENSENILKLNQTTVDLLNDTQPKNTAAKKVLVDTPGLNTEINTYFEGKKDVGVGGKKKGIRKSKKRIRRRKSRKNTLRKNRK